MKESKKEIINKETTEKNNTLQVITVIINFLQLFIPITIAKKLVSMILIANFSICANNRVDFTLAKDV